ncbi:MAG: 2-oxo acid dehydrogenase subunit E2 [Spirochaetae bacterium HGW-Spirochaetae-3]|nr:MAG: 2-oxo acid dehydrogenase subunit E2 [Spirochaetae bacterium HGW-Spirochaetae-3]
MIALSPTMQDGVIAEWIAEEGQAVKPGDALCEVETDKATMPYESPVSGTVLKIVKAAGQTAAVGEIIAVLGKPGEDWAAVIAGATPVAERPAAGPSAGVTSTEASFPALGPIEPTVAAPAAPPLSAPPAAPRASTASAPSSPAGASPSSPAGIPPSSPLARRLARDGSVDLRTLRGSGPHGRVVARDIMAAAGKDTVNADAPKSAAPGGASIGMASRGLRDERVPLSRMRSIIAKRLGDSYSEAPHFFVRAAIDMERLLELRAAVNEGRDKPIGLNAFVMKLTAAALERHPLVNASWEGDAIRYRPAADIGLAVSLDAGLITPVVRACERKGVEDIDAELADMVARARSGALKPEEYADASFTVSNLGQYGVEEFTAIINPPGSAILTLGAVSKEAVVRGDAIVARRTMRVTLSSDHRVIDGAVAAAFVAELKALLEEPALALV